MKRICFCCTIPATFNFSMEVFSFLRDRGDQVILISSEKEKLSALGRKIGVKYFYLPMRRSISPVSDIRCIGRLRRFLADVKPDIVIGATPKAAMISMIASRLAGVRHRIYHIYGLPLETAHGIKRHILEWVERVTGRCATVVIPISNSVKERTIELGLFPSGKLVQPGLLTVGGVDPLRFSPDRFDKSKDEIKAAIGIPNGDKVIGFIGRLTYDKGLKDIIDIWSRMNPSVGISLLIVGDIDERVPLSADMTESFFYDKKVFHIGYNNEVEKYFSVIDIFLFPSYREGFGNVNVEAQAMKIPVISYDVTGCRDSVENGVTGYTVPFRDYDAVIDKLHQLLSDDDLRAELGASGRHRVIANFTRNHVADDFLSFISVLD